MDDLNRMTTALFYCVVVHENYLEDIELPLG